MNHFTNRQVIGLCILSIGFGAAFTPPLKSVAQPPETPPSTPELSETPQPLATPPASAEGVSSVRTTQAVGPITGQGTAGFVSKFIGPNAIGNSVIFENAGKIGIGTTTPAGLLSVRGGVANINPIYALNTSTGNAIFGTSNGIGIYGQHTGTGGDQPGVYGETGSNSVNAAGVLGTMLHAAPGVSSAGVRGVNRSTNANGFGVYGTHAGSGSGVSGDSVSGTGVRGRHTLNSGVTPGVSGETNSTSANAVGVQGVINSTSPGGSSAGVRGINNGTSSSGIGVYGSHAGYGYGVYGVAPNGYGVVASSTNGYGLYASSSTGYGLYASSGSSYGIYGYSGSSSGRGVYGSSSGTGVYGQSTGGSAGVYGKSSGNAVYGESTNGFGVYGTSSNGGVVGRGYVGVQGTASGTNNSQGVRGEDGAGGSSTTTYAGVFVGRVGVFGTLSKTAGSFKIDHPQRPATEYLSHSFVESPDMMNVYNGNTKLDSKGEAIVKLPSYFQALNRDFRYQLTCVGAPALVYVAQKINNNRFKIAGGKPGMEVSWQVTGIRDDVYARQHRIRVEEAKTGQDRGRYLYPAGFGFGKDKQIGGNLRLAQH